MKLRKPSVIRMLYIVIWTMAAVGVVYSWLGRGIDLSRDEHSIRDVGYEFQGVLWFLGEPTEQGLPFDVLMNSDLAERGSEGTTFTVKEGHRALTKVSPELLGRELDVVLGYKLRIDQYEPLPDGWSRIRLTTRTEGYGLAWNYKTDGSRIVVLGWTSQSEKALALTACFGVCGWPFLAGVLSLALWWDARATKPHASRQRNEANFVLQSSADAAAKARERRGDSASGNP